MSKWISVDEQMPEAKVKVLVAIESSTNGKHFISTAKYIPPKTVLAEDFLDPNYSDGGEYDEEKDCYWTEAGWYEWQYEPDVNWMINDKVTHWIPIPQLSSEVGAVSE